MESRRVELECKGEARRKEKEEAASYLNERGAQKQLELLLNEAVRVKPADLFGYLTREMNHLSYPVTIYQVVGHNLLGIDGEKAVEVTVHCTINGIPEAVTSAICSIPPPVVVTPAPRSQSSLSRSSRTSTAAEDLTQPDVTADALDTIEQVVTKSSELLKDKEITDVQALDLCLESSDISVLNNSTAVWTVSLALVKSACQLLHRPLYEMVATLGGVENDSLHPPLPIAKMLSAGDVTNGKLKIRDFSVIPSQTMDYEEGIHNICKFHRFLGRVLTAKYGPSALAVLPDGSYAPSLDKPEQAFDLLQEAMIAAQLEWKTQLSLVVNINASHIHDTEKNRYELTAGQWKPRDDLLTYYSDLTAQRPELLALENPFTDQDTDSWQKLSERLGDGYIIIGKHGRPEMNVEERTDTETEAVPVASMQIDKLTWDSQATLTQLCQTSKRIRAGKNQLLLNVDSELNSECVADVALGVLATYIKLPGPTSGDFLRIYNRLVETYHDVTTKNKLSQTARNSSQTEIQSD